MTATITAVARVLELAERRGPQGIDQQDFTHPTADGGPTLGRLVDLIAGDDTLRSRLTEIGRDDGTRAWVHSEHLPDRYEHFRTGWACVACGSRHASSWPENTCGRCGGGPLLRARVVHRDGEAVA